MVSSRRRASSPTSSCTSYRSSCENHQTCKTALADRERHRKGTEQISAEDEREVARRVLEDLEQLYFDNYNGEESEDEDAYDSSSEWGAEASSRSSRGGITLEELTVAVNAAIEYHRPTKPNAVQPHAKVLMSKNNGSFSQYAEDLHSRPYRRDQRKYSPTPSSQTGKSVLEMFQDMLERKEKHFYALRATKVATDDEPRENQTREVAEIRTVTVDRQQQTTAYVRDQATETEEHSHQPALDASFGVADFDTPLHSPSPSVHSASNDLTRPIEVGPTLADLANSHRRMGRIRLSSQSRPAADSSWSLSFSRSATDPSISRLQSSFASSSSSSSNRSSSIKSDVSSRHSHSSKKSSRSKTYSKPSPRSQSSEHSSHKSLRQAKQEPSVETTQPTDKPFELAQKDQVEKDGHPVVSPPSQVPSSPELVKWELDLSNFAF